jgi:aspartate/methionine/tyrosine aminotransferase
MAVTEPSFTHAEHTSTSATSDLPAESASFTTPTTTAITTSRRTRVRSTPRYKTTANGRQTTEDIRAAIARLRDEACERYKDQTKVAAPIRLMARMVKEIEAICRERGYPAEIAAAEVVNRTIGDVDLRRVSAKDDGPEYVSLADDVGIALPGEVIDGHRATGATYRWIRERMLDFERTLLKRHFDLRMYDVPATGNPLLREMVSDYALRSWGFTLPAEQIYLSLGALDGLDKFWRGLAAALRKEAGDDQRYVGAVAFPAPSFNVPEWQAQSVDLRLHRLMTRPEDHFKVTPAMLRQTLAESPDVHAFYLTVSNNPTAFAYTPDELSALFDALAEAPENVYLVADLAYIGTGIPEDDRARMQAFNRPDLLRRAVFVNSFSKTHTLTGDRCGWVGFGDPALASRVSPGWTNSTATLPGDWQLRYMAYVQLFTERPEIGERIRGLYAHRRARLIRQLERIQQQQGLFARVNLDDGGTVYNWSQLLPGEDAFSLFRKTGIAGVPGSGFGYRDDFLRFSVGCIPVPAV